MARMTGLTLSVFTAGGTNLLATIRDAVIIEENNTEDGAGVAAAAHAPVALKGKWHCEITEFVDAVAPLIASAISGATLALVATSGSGAGAVGTYAGNAYIKSYDHSGPGGLQTARIQFKGQGALGYTVA